jgi:two-component system cell cycle response regulator
VPDDEIVSDGITLRLAEAMAGVAAAADVPHARDVAEVSLLAARVARRLGNPQPLVLRCRLAGLLHDVGNVQLPASVRAKPGPLDHDEWELVRRHPALGEALVAAVPDLRPVAPIVRQRHERHDGSGYPDGLAGEGILLEARIVAAADTWSAMTSARPHRPALDAETALLELDRAAGTQLDPEVVEALKSVLAHPREADPR